MKHLYTRLYIAAWCLVGIFIVIEVLVIVNDDAPLAIPSSRPSVVEPTSAQPTDDNGVGTPEGSGFMDDWGDGGRGSDDRDDVDPGSDDVDPGSDDVDPGSDDVDPGLAEYGLTNRDVLMIHQVGLDTGYTFSGFPPEDTAYLGIAVCERVREGSTTWRREVDEAVGQGAPVSAAQEWNGYLRTYFCPYLQ